MVDRELRGFVDYGEKDRLKSAVGVRGVGVRNLFRGVGVRNLFRGVGVRNLFRGFGVRNLFRGGLDNYP